jgi:hypothetical protein
MKTLLPEEALTTLDTEEASDIFLFLVAVPPPRLRPGDALLPSQLTFCARDHQIKGPKRLL